jgi:predicted lipoprotein with Yx(FWY)xxD motif
MSPFTRSRRPLVGAALPGALAVVLAGCGASTHRQATSHERMPMTHTRTSMAMGHSGGHTAAAMLGMAVAHADVTVGPSPHYGNVLYDKDHFVLYTFSADHGSSSTCYGACEKAWPPMLTKGAPHAACLSSSLLGTSRRRGGSLQVTYGGHPLYYWSGDTSKSIMCQHVKLHGGFWYVVDASGTANTAKGIGTMSAMG